MCRRFGQVLARRQSKSLENILITQPDNSYAHALLAIWNMEVLQRGGRIGARIMGASSRAGLMHYESAAERLPDDGALHWQWARVLAATNARKYRKNIDAALHASISATTNDALEHAMQARAKKFMQDMETLNTREIEALAKSML